MERTREFSTKRPSWRKPTSATSESGKWTRRGGTHEEVIRKKPVMEEANKRRRSEWVAADEIDMRVPRDTYYIVGRL